jgi:hypothetical protein
MTVQIQTRDLLLAFYLLVEIFDAPSFLLLSSRFSKIFLAPTIITHTFYCNSLIPTNFLRALHMARGVLLQ